MGALDLIRDFRAPGEWWLGLLMLDPRERELRRQPYTAPTGHRSTLIVMSRQISHAGAP